MKFNGCFNDLTSTAHLSTTLTFFIATLCLFPLPSSHAASSLFPGNPLTDGATIVSPGGIFELGFFSPGSSNNRYLGIWYRNSTAAVVWVANRESPVPNSFGSLAIAADGNLVVLDGERRKLWSSNASLLPASALAVELLDSGNLVLKNSGATAWQSFEHPTDVYLPGMKVGLDLRTNVNHVFSSWRSSGNPAPGNFTMGMGPDRSTQIFMWENGDPRWRSGRWNGQIFIGVQGMVPEYIYGFRLNNFETENVMYFYYNVFNSTQRFVLTPDGVAKQILRQDSGELWTDIWAQPSVECEIYNRCGDYASCSDGDDNSPVCSCLKGFVSQPAGGCRRRTPLQCERNGSASDKPDGFLLMQEVKLPDLSDWDPASLNETRCEESCLANCSCKAYSFVTGIGCLIWGRELVDIHVFSTGGNDLYLRLAGEELDQKVEVPVFLILIIGIPALFSLGIIFLVWVFRKRIKAFFMRGRRQEEASVNPSSGAETEMGLSGVFKIEDGGSNNGNSRESAMFSYDTVVEATEHFAESKLLGEGGFGPVYKGVLPGGQEIAVKRLSKRSGQGMEQFKNEVILLAKLQHRNLVRLLGFCIHKDHKMLIYEFMPNKSLDVILFDHNRKRSLDWKARYKIIEGIARGLLYLHRDSRLRVIHRDLKASNILLDECMNPRISDFGMARIFGSDCNETTTKRVVGTYGYMSPEYAMQGLFSVKSDVYSFGILILEIVSGERNSTYQHPHLYLNLIAYAWKLWNEGKMMELVDHSIRDSSSTNEEEVSRCVNVGLSCLQDRAHERPRMASVVLMLEGGSALEHLMMPRQPTFEFERSTSESDYSTDPRFISEISMITRLSGR